MHLYSGFSATSPSSARNSPAKLSKEAFSNTGWRRGYFVVDGNVMQLKHWSIGEQIYPRVLRNVTLSKDFLLNAGGSVEASQTSKGGKGCSVAAQDKVQYGSLGRVYRPL
jgi:hypothetical protein